MFDTLFKSNGKKVKYMGMVNIRKYFEVCLGSYYNPKTEYVVLWYGKIYYYRRRKTVQVYFLNSTTKKQVVVGVSIKSILKLPIGSIWVDGICEEKYDFETLYTTLDAYNDKQQERPNLTYTNHFGISANKGNYILEPDNYPVDDIKTDSNTNLVVQTGNTKIVIPSVLFFVAHYGVSKEINKVLISYHKEEAEERLNINDNYGDLITIPDRCVIADAVFLFYLKTNGYTKKVVWNLNSRMLRNDRQYLSLMAQPYHKQEIQLKISGLKIDDQTILCTEILGMSMPQGSEIEYRIDKPNSATYGEGVEPQTLKFQPIYNTIESDEIILEAQRDANNITTAVVRHRIEQIGQIRALVKSEDLTLDEVIDICNSKIIRLPQNEPDAFSDGEDGNANGDIGRLQALSESGAIHLIKNNFERLLRYAQDLKVTLGYSPVIIDCVNLANDNIFIGETVRGMRIAKYDSNVEVVFVMRLIFEKHGLFYIFDCQKKGIQTSGIVIKVANEDTFIRDAIRRILSQLFRNNGRLADVSEISGFSTIKYFKHTNGESSNWVKTAIDNWLQVVN
ncbi:hypothetical protein ACTXJF_08880 [Psychrobacter alimentarius]|uniref:hypothetical protein n=1 Tax=Psychrobacter alimentarius TaxID=261164 RepID=UPI003FD6000C